LILVEAMPSEASVVFSVTADADTSIVSLVVPISSVTFIVAGKFTSNWRDFCSNLRNPVFSTVSV